jgi:hypothetical protein
MLIAAGNDHWQLSSEVEVPFQVCSGTIRWNPKLIDVLGTLLNSLHHIEVIQDLFLNALSLMPLFFYVVVDQEGFAFHYDYRVG